MHYRGPVRRAAALALAMALAGCTSGQDPTIGAGDTSAPGGTGTSAPGISEPGTSAPDPTVPAQAPPISTPPVDPRGYLTAVRAAAAPGGGSRVVFEFDPVVPGYTIDYTERPVTEDGSGDEIAVEGDAVLSVRFENAGGARIEGEKVIRTYTGAGRVPATGDRSVVTEVVDAGDFEGVVTWVVGVRQRVPEVSVSTLGGPSRLVIDVPAPTAG